MGPETVQIPGEWQPHLQPVYHFAVAIMAKKQTNGNRRTLPPGECAPIFWTEGRFIMVSPEKPTLGEDEVQRRS